MSKGESKKEMLERFEKMGIPKPLSSVAAPAPVKNKEIASKLDAIRNGSLKEDFSSFIEKAEKTSSSPTVLPVPKVGSKPGEKTTSSPKLESYAPKQNSQALSIESMMFGDSNNTSYTSSKSDVQDYGPKNVDTKSLLQSRLNKKHSEQSLNESSFNHDNNLNLTEAELTEKITEIAKEVSKKMIKSVILEMQKNGGDLITESKNVRKAEILGKNKIKIGNQTFLIQPIK
jgi:hypothetical protein